MEFLLLPQVAPFTAALAGLVFIMAVELATLVLVGVAGMTHALDTVFDVDSTPDVAGLDWLVIKGLPLMVTIVVALAGFGCAGLLANALAGGPPGTPMSLLPALSVAVVGALASIRGAGALVKRLNIKFDSEAVSLQSLAGGLAVLASPVARKDFPGHALARDPHGNTHNIFVVPETDGVEFHEGQTVKLISFDGSTFRAQSLT